ncbi:MAG: hypothetical protein M5T61_19840 [Acidimicrobiia bacterium]|nr:hypothetical protein [Acidimicrobiia bacterium]
MDSGRTELVRRLRKYTTEQVITYRSARSSTPGHTLTVMGEHCRP